MPRSKIKPPVKGQPIRFVRGSYTGEKGWLDTANKPRKNAKSDKVWVIIDNTDESQNMEGTHTKVEITSIRHLPTAPTTWAQAAVQQHPTLESKVIEMARHFASCDMEGHEHEVVDLIAHELQFADNQIRSSRCALWKKVVWKKK